MSMWKSLFWVVQQSLSPNSSRCLWRMKWLVCWGGERVVLPHLAGQTLNSEGKMEAERSWSKPLVSSRFHASVKSDLVFMPSDRAPPGTTAFIDQESPYSARGGDGRTDLSKNEEAMKILRRRARGRDILNKPRHTQRVSRELVLGSWSQPGHPRILEGSWRQGCKDSPNKGWETYSVDFLAG